MVKQITEQQAKFIKQINKMKKNEVNVIAYLAMQKDYECLGYTSRQLAKKIFNNENNFKRLYDSVSSLNEYGIIKLEQIDPGTGHKGYFNIKLRKDWVEYISSLYEEE